MTPSPPRPLQRRFGFLALPIATFAGFAAAFIAVLVVGFVSWRAIGERAAAADAVTLSMQTITQAQAVLSILKDAETGQRGYLLSGSDRYLEPYFSARSDLARSLAQLRDLTMGRALQQRRTETLASLAGEKMNELAETIELRRSGQSERALAVVLTDRGKIAMDRIRNTARDLVVDERGTLEQRQGEWEEAVRSSAMTATAGAAVLLFLIAAAALTASRDYRAQKTEAWLRGGQLGLADVVAGEQRLEGQGDAVLAFLANYLRAQVGALYVAHGTGQLQRIGSYALASDVDAARTDGNAGLLGRALIEKRPLRVSDVPAGYLPISSALGSAAPVELLIAPASVDGVVHAVVELGFFRRLDAVDEKLLERVSETLALAVRSGKDRLRVQQLLEETQQQSEELQTQQEELRVGNEELEEQSRALRESQAMLESQQAELEQTNSQLGTQTHLLERQNDALAEAQVALRERADALERSNQVKSEFLANMSHELRTPLNSTLILAKLLADNKHGNLSAEQVKFAETISSAGNDLLALINDILDLSKLEAGKVEIVVEPVDIARIAESMRKTFEPVAAQRRLGFAIRVEPDAPASIDTDAQRLGQILRNLIANALKFTEQGDAGRWAPRCACTGPTPGR